MNLTDDTLKVNRVLSNVDGPPASMAEQVVVLATHRTDASDRVIFHQMAGELRQSKIPAELWALIYHEEHTARVLEIDAAMTRDLGAPTCVWGDATLAAYYPRVTEA